MGAAGVVLVVILALLTCVEAYKIYAVAAHLLWINANGSLYRQALLELGDRGGEPTTADVHEALDDRRRPRDLPGIQGVPRARERLRRPAGVTAPAHCARHSQLWRS